MPGDPKPHAGSPPLPDLLGLLADPEAAERLSPLGDRPVCVIDVEAASRDAALPDPRAGILIGIDRKGEAPAGLDVAFDVLLTPAATPGPEWVRVDAAALDAEAARLEARALANPFAASIYCQVLRLSERLSFADGLILESLAYSTLLAGGEFRRWRGANPVRRAAEARDGLVRSERMRDTLRVTLARPEAHNALSAAMRNQLAEALRVAAADPMIRRVTLAGEGPSFCSGGDLDEFGTADDQAMAHAIRVTRSVAAIVHGVAERTSAKLHGACLGAGIEIPAAAGCVVAARDTIMGLPELGMGLIPGAGGTVTVRRRIGRHRTCWLGLSGERIGALQALAWGLVDAVEDEA